MTIFNLDVEEIIDFYDANTKAHRHSAAIKLFAHEELAVALLLRYLRTQDENTEVTALDIPCATTGARLDKWVHVKGAMTTFCYQVEVKAWSMHGYPRGKPLDATTSHENLANPMEASFRKCWNEEAGWFAKEDKGLSKVLLRMCTEFEPVHPLLCIWAPMHPDWRKDAEPLFDMKVRAENNDGGFERLWFFSVSAYLRQQLLSGVPRIEVELPDADVRLKFLHAILGIGSVPRTVV